MRPSRTLLPSLALFVAGILLGSQFQPMNSPLQQVNATQQPANPDRILPKEEPATVADHPVSKLTDKMIDWDGTYVGLILKLPEKQLLSNFSSRILGLRLKFANHGRSATTN